MRLRYLHLQNRPPLADVAIQFNQQGVLERSCAIHFVVGVNGSGKSRLLQAIAEIFLSLEREAMPPFPATLAYDLGNGDSAHTIYLYYPGGAKSSTQLVVFDQKLPEATNWEELENISRSERTDYTYNVRQLYRGDNLPGTGAIGILLPKVLLAYTSGATASWRDLFTSKDMSLGDILSGTSGNLDSDQERPPGWDTAKEIANKRRTEKGAGEEDTNESQQEGLASGLVSISRSTCYFVPPEALKLALCVIALDQAVKESPQRVTEEAKASFLTQIKESKEAGVRMPDLRGILNEVGWLWPVTIGLRIALRPERLSREQKRALSELYYKSTTVLREPEPGAGRYLLFDLWRPQEERVDENRSTAAALIEAIGGENTAPFEVFQKLLRWQQEGLLEDVIIAFSKLGLDDMVLYDWLSDGEQAFLGRMALFHVLNGIGDSLILLDEPETHFNDIWRREIVDIIDTSLQESPSNVVISTHSSIALSDIFAEEIILLRKDVENGLTQTRPVTTPTFGADPSEIMVQVFEAPDSIGKRALEYLATWLKHDWKPEERAQLEQLIRQTGPGYFRSELRTIWRELRATQN